MAEKFQLGGFIKWLVSHSAVVIAAVLLIIRKAADILEERQNRAVSKTLKEVKQNALYDKL